MIKSFFMALIVAGLMAGCATAQKNAEVGDLTVTLNPAEISYGISSEVTALASDGAEMKWMKGTVEFPGQRVPTVKLKEKKGSKAWSRRFPPIPQIIQVKPGNYNVRVWGISITGREYQGNAQVTFK